MHQPAQDDRQDWIDRWSNDLVELEQLIAQLNTNMLDVETWLTGTNLPHQNPTVLRIYALDIVIRGHRVILATEAHLLANGSIEFIATPPFHLLSGPTVAISDVGKSDWRDWIVRAMEIAVQAAQGK